MNNRGFRFLAIIGSMLILAAILLARPAFHLLNTLSEDTTDHLQTRSGTINDASRLNQTEISEVWEVPVHSDNFEGQLADLLLRARAEGRRVSIAGARHSMGGHTFYPGGIVVDMLRWNKMELDTSENILHVQSGALWKDVIEYLDPLGRSVWVMQSNNSFSVGGSISVNCHGWQYNRPPIASTVESFRLMKASGEIVRCSREENHELFTLALGGYGLFGIIMDVDLRVVLNARYQLEQHVVSVDQALAAFDSMVSGQAEVPMVYARMSIVPDRLFDEVILNVFSPDTGGAIPDLTDRGAETLRRAVFRGSAESEYGKELRWDLETRIQPLLFGKTFSRNQLLNEGVEVFENRTSHSTDILHEYFVPRSRVMEFVDSMRAIITVHEANLLNVTVRSVNEDKDTFLRYADQAMIAFVMLFVQETTDEGERAMKALTENLIDAAIQHDGSYYLTYRLHATVEQFDRAYPQGRDFFLKKREYDPMELFQNHFYLKYARTDH